MIKPISRQTIWHCLVISILALLSATISLNAQTIDVCENAERCEPLFDSSTVRIARIISTTRLFANPTLSVEIDIAGSPDGNIRLYLPPAEDELLVLTPAEDQNTCDLLIAGIENEADTDTIQYVDVSAETRAIRLYAFCTRYNLPNQATNNQPWPSGILFDREDGTLLGERLITLTDTERKEAIKTVLHRAHEGMCSRDGVSPGLSLTDLSTQFAIFIGYRRTEQDVDPIHDFVWQYFIEEARNSVFLRDYAAIYCLLDLEAPPVATRLDAEPLNGEAPLQMTFTSDLSETSHILGYKFEIYPDEKQEDAAWATSTPTNQPNSETGNPFSPPSDQLCHSDALLCENNNLPTTFPFTEPGRYRARLTVWVPPYTYNGATVVQRTPETKTLEITVNAPTAGLVMPTATPGVLDRRYFETGITAIDNITLSGFLFRLGVVSVLTVVIFVGFSVMNEKRSTGILMIGLGLAGIILVIISFSLGRDTVTQPEDTTEIIGDSG